MSLEHFAWQCRVCCPDDTIPLEVFATEAERDEHDAEHRRTSGHYGDTYTTTVRFTEP